MESLFIGGGVGSQSERDKETVPRCDWLMDEPLS